MMNSYNPVEVAMLSKVVDEACLRLGRGDDETKRLLAQRVMRYAEQGERDFDALLAVALNGVGVAEHAA